jgi:hypothetical protein
MTHALYWSRPPPHRQVAVDNYTEWIQLVASMTISSLQSWQWANQSMWAR